jgi:hypothetical protein
MGDVVHPVPSTCKLQGHRIEWEIFGVDAFYIRIFTLMALGEVTELLTLVQSVLLRFIVPMSQSAETTAILANTPTRMMSSMMTFGTVMNRN